MSTSREHLRNRAGQSRRSFIKATSAAAGSLAAPLDILGSPPQPDSAGIIRPMDAPEGTVKVWLFRARELLRKKLEQTFGP